MTVGTATKVSASHVARTAYLYTRQSTLRRAKLGSSATEESLVAPVVDPERRPVTPPQSPPPLGTARGPTAGSGRQCSERPGYPVSITPPRVAASASRSRGRPRRQSSSPSRSNPGASNLPRRGASATSSTRRTTNPSAGPEPQAERQNRRSTVPMAYGTRATSRAGPPARTQRTERRPCRPTQSRPHPARNRITTRKDGKRSHATLWARNSHLA